MVFIKTLLLFGIAAVSAMTLPSTARSDTVVSVPAAALPAAPDFSIGSVERREARGRTSLQWAPQGRYLLLIGAQIPEGIIHSFLEQPVGATAGDALWASFRTWLSENEWDEEHSRANTIILGGGLQQAIGAFGVGLGNIGNTIGFLLQVRPEWVGDYNINAVLNAIHDWASRLGNVVEVRERPNGFVDLAAIGAAPTKRDESSIETRSRDFKCPADIDILKYAVIDVPDLDLNKNLRAAGTCTP